MSVRVSDEHLDCLRIQVTDRLKRARKNSTAQWLMLGDDAILLAQDLTKVLDELCSRREKRRQATNGGPTAQMLIQFEVGDEKVMPPIASSTLSTAKKGARRQPGFEKAVWYSETLEDGMMKITRVPDGSNPYPHRGITPVIREVAEMAVNETKIVALTNGKQRLTTDMRERAKKYMNCPNAKWETIKLVNGSLKCKRVR